MSKRTKVQAAIPQQITQFFDVEAAEEQGEGLVSSDYDESDQDFVVGDDVDKHTGRVGRSEHLYRWDHLTRSDEMNVLHEVARDIQRRHRPSGPGLIQPSVMHPLLRPLPSVVDPGIWRVHVKDGYERDVVLSILQKVLLSAQAAELQGVLAAFSRDTLSGSIYVESFTSEDVRIMLSGISGVIHSRQKTPRIELVPLDDRVALLNMGRSSTITRGAWVRVKCRGHYRGDLGLVVELEEQYASAEVALVPRINLTLKRDRRKCPKPALFDPQAVAAMYGVDAVVRRNQVFVFKDDVYKNGLLRRNFGLHVLSDRHVEPTHDELDLFRQTRDDWVVEAADARIVPLRCSDKIKVVAGPSRGIIGRLTSIEDEQSVTLESDSSPVPLQVLVHEVRKRFDLGDFVEVVYGQHRGVAGFIVDMDDNSAIIYSQKQAMHSGILHQLPGDEVQIDLRHIDWKSPDVACGNGQPQFHEDRRNEIRSKMFTGDPYKGIEISIHAGDAKMHFGVVLGSWRKEEKIVVDVVTSTRTVNTAMTLDLESVRERNTGLPLARARWVPKSGLPLWDGSLTDERPKTPSTPMHPLAGPQSPAWDPTTPMPGSSRLSGTSGYDCRPSGELSVDSGSAPGEWLLDARLLHKRLDVCIQGTLTTLSHNGRYEGQCGYMVLTRMPSNVKVSVPVKIGFAESRIFFPLRHISPLHTTQRPGFVSSTQALPIISVVGERIVIIGADMKGNSELIGNYALVVQNDLIKSYMPDFEAKTLEVDPGLENKSTTKYRQEKTSEIMESELFIAESDKKDLRARIMKKFSNHYQEMKRKRGVCGIRRNGATEKPIKLFEEPTGRQLFEEARKEDINKEATQRRTTSSSGNHAGHYQAVLKEMWEGLAEDEREKYNKGAQDHSDDVSVNQEQFMSAMWKQLKNMCQNGKLGHAEMMLLFAFRDQEGDVKSGFVSGHSVENSTDMRDFVDDFKEHIEIPWNQYANHVLPSNPAEEPKPGYPIPRDSSGLPLFPMINLQKTTPDDVISHCTEYFSVLWAHTWPYEKDMPKIPWNEIWEHPSRYYDHTTFSFPIRLQAPDLMSLRDLYSVIDLLSTFQKPFAFYSKEKILHETRIQVTVDEDAQTGDDGLSALDKDHGDGAELHEYGESSRGVLQTGLTSCVEGRVELHLGRESRVITSAAARSNGVADDNDTTVPPSKPRVRRQIKAGKKSDESTASGAARSNMPTDGSETVTSLSEQRVKRQIKPRKRWDDDNGTVASSSKATMDLKRKAATATGLEKPNKKRQRRPWFAYVDQDGNPCDKDGNRAE